MITATTAIMAVTTDTERGVSSVLLERDAIAGRSLLSVGLVCTPVIAMPICTSCENPVSYDFAQAHGNGERVDWCPRCQNGR
ncbi:hypothetical protein NDO75_27455 [Natrinema sp. 1APR25-10V2]|nr:hypothetical protein [Natrinema sp. 1APR25-10V2]